MHSLWMTVGFSELHPYVGFLRSYNCFLLYISLALQGKLMTRLPLNPPTAEQEMGETCQIQHSAPPSQCRAGKGKSMPLKRGAR